MSADNGVYILKTPARPIKDGDCYTNRHGVYEYRISHCQAIDNLDYSDLYVVAYFADSEIFYDEQEASKKAAELHDELGWTEYGICFVEKDVCFPNMTVEEANKALDSYVLPSDISQ